MHPVFGTCPFYFQTTRATSCATPGNRYEILFWSSKHVVWTTFAGILFKGESRVRLECKGVAGLEKILMDEWLRTPKAGALPTALHPVIQFFKRFRVYSQTTRATNCATPGNRYEILFWSSKHVVWTTFTGILREQENRAFLRVSRVSAVAEKSSGLRLMKSQTTRAANCATPG